MLFKQIQDKSNYIKHINYYIYNLRTYKFDFKEVSYLCSKFTIINDVIRFISDRIGIDKATGIPIELSYDQDMMSITSFDIPFDIYFDESEHKWSHELCFLNIRSLYNAMYAVVEIYNNVTRLYTRIDYSYGFPYIRDTIEIDMPRSFTRFAWKLDHKYGNYTEDEIGLIIRIIIDNTIRFGLSSKIVVYNYTKFMTVDVINSKFKLQKATPPNKTAIVQTTIDDDMYIPEQNTHELNVDDIVPFLYFIHFIKYNLHSQLYETSSIDLNLLHMHLDLVTINPLSLKDYAELMFDVILPETVLKTIQSESIKFVIYPKHIEYTLPNQTSFNKPHLMQGIILTDKNYVNNVNFYPNFHNIVNGEIGYWGVHFNFVKDLISANIHVTKNISSTLSYILTKKTCGIIVVNATTLEHNENNRICLYAIDNISTIPDAIDLECDVFDRLINST